MKSEHTMLLALVAFLVKHYFCDFPLQTVYMLGKGKGGLDWIMPLASHSGVHAFFTVIILAIYKPQFIWLAALEFVAHFAIDRVKATHKLEAGVWTPETRGKNLGKYYRAFGMDQLAHYLTYAGILFIASL